MPFKLVNPSTRRKLLINSKINEAHDSNPQEVSIMIPHGKLPVRPEVFNAGFAANYRYDPYTQSMCDMDGDSSTERQRLSRFTSQRLHSPTLCGMTHTSPPLEPVLDYRRQYHQSVIREPFPIHTLPIRHSEERALQPTSEERCLKQQSVMNSNDRHRRENILQRGSLHGKVVSPSSRYHFEVSAAKRQKLHGSDSSIVLVPKTENVKRPDDTARPLKAGGYDPTTIACDILKALGKHPILPPLNSNHFPDAVPDGGTEEERQARQSAAYEHWLVMEQVRAKKKPKVGPRKAKTRLRDNVGHADRSYEQRWNFRDDQGDDSEGFDR